MPDDRDLEQRLRAYESRIPDADLPDPTSSRSRSSPWRIARAAGAAAAGVGAAALAVVLLSAIPSDRDLGPSPSASSSQPPTASPRPGSSASVGVEAPSPATPTPTPTQIPGSAITPAWTWTEGVAPEGTVYAVIWLGDRWLAAGSLGERAASWTSTDGLTWEPGAPIGPENQVDESGFSDRYRMHRLIEFNGEIFGLGVRAYGGGDGIEYAAWRSSDGVTWTFVDTTGREYYAAPVDAAIAPAGDLVVVGSTQLGGGTSTFTSPDGSTWQEHVFSEADGSVIRSVAASDILLVGVGTGQGGPRVWTSVDGRSWREAAVPERNAILWSIAWDAMGGRFIASGRDHAGRPTIWTSPDAATWSQVALSEEPGEVFEIAAEGGAIIAVGTTGGYPPTALNSWTSLDGSAWDSVILAPSGDRPVAAILAECAVVWLHRSTGEPDFRQFMEVWVAR